MRLPFWPRSSTRSFAREGLRVPGYGLFDWLHGYVYARWPYLYIGIGTGEHPLTGLVKPIIGRAQKLVSHLPRPASGGMPFSDFADTYHGKVVTLETATRLVKVERDVDLGDLEQVIPYAMARDIILKNPDHIIALQCPCRTARKQPCQPLDVCLIVGEPFASFVAEHHRERSRWITSDEAAEILAAEHERGHVSHAFFKDAMLGRFYAICNCCACCCGAMQAHQNGVPMLASSGYISRSDHDLCIGCGECTTSCQFHALSLDGGRSIVDLEKCMGCGVCVDKCTQGALSLIRDESKGIPLDMDALLREAVTG